MANLIDKTYFVGDIMLPDKKLTGDLANIDVYIAKYEPEILLKMLGYDLYKPLQAQIDSGSPYDAPWADFIEGAEYTVGDYTVKWNGLVNTQKDSLIAYYIYFFYMKDLVSSTTGVGEVLNNAENSDRMSPANKQANAWNRHLDLYGRTTDGLYVPSAYRYLTVKESLFDLWLFTPEISVNAFDI